MAVLFQGCEMWPADSSRSINRVQDVCSSVGQLLRLARSEKMAVLFQGCEMWPAGKQQNITLGKVLLVNRRSSTMQHGEPCGVCCHHFMLKSMRTKRYVMGTALPHRRNTSCGV
jgi:hypothetical protein